MQATMNPAAPAPRLQFARRDYMVRSEKRPSPIPKAPEPDGGRPPRKRKKGAGLFYKLITVLLLLILWPVGMILLWKRKLRWSALTKLFASVIMLVAFVLLLCFALTVDTGNARYAAVQDGINSFLDDAGVKMMELGDATIERIHQSSEALDELVSVYGADARAMLADCIDQGVELAQDLRSRADELIAKISSKSETDEEADASEAVPAQDIVRDEAIADADKPTSAPTSAPAAEITVSAEGDALPVYIPESDSEIDAGAPVTEGILGRSGLLDEVPLPTPEPEPEPESYDFYVKPAAEAIVYFNIGSGRFYHMVTVCGSMKDADTHAFAETLENIHEPCSRCTPPDKSLLEETYIVWVDENEIAHLSDECESFEGQWRMLTAADAIEAEYVGCPDCGADRYLKALADGMEITLLDGPEVEPTPEPTDEPTPEPSEEASAKPTPKASAEPTAPTATLRPASEGQTA